MGNIVQIKVSVRRLISLKNYENVAYEVEATATVSEHEAPSDVYENTLAFCQDKICEEMDRLASNRPHKPYKKTLQDDPIPSGFTAQPSSGK